MVLAGRPLGLGPAEDADGLLMGYLPGTEGGTAVADALFGTVELSYTTFKTSGLPPPAGPHGTAR